MKIISVIAFISSIILMGCPRSIKTDPPIERAIPVKEIVSVLKNIAQAQKHNDFWQAVQPSKQDCQTEDFSSDYVDCDPVELCCDDDGCWYHLIDQDFDTLNEDTVVDELCDFDSLNVRPEPYVRYAPYMTQPLL